MKEPQNQLHQFINEQKELIKKEFILLSKNSLLNGSYYMLAPRDKDRSTISTDIGELTVVDYHLTIYQENKKEVQNSAFHITIKLIDKAKKAYVARIYYTEFGEYLFDKVKDGTNNFIEINSEEKLLDFGKKNISVLLNIILKIQQNYNEQYCLMDDELKRQSRALENIDPLLLKKKLSAYEQSLLITIKHIQSGTMFNQEHLADLKIYELFLWDTQQKLSQQQENLGITEQTPKNLEHSIPIIQPSVAKQNNISATNNTVKIDVLNKKIAVITHSKKTRTPSMVLQEYELQSQKLSLLNTESSKSNKKSKRSQNDINDTDFMNTTSKKIQLQAEINSMVSDSLDDDKRYKNIDQESMEALIQKCSLTTSVLLELAVKNNRLLFLKILMQLRKDIDFELKSRNKNQFLLEIAYEQRYLEIFKCLLENGASPDIICSDKLPIIFDACLDGRIDEMELLLEAKASPFAMNSTKFTPLGALTMRKNGPPPNLKQLELFLAYVPRAIDDQQGSNEQKNNPLGYACQQDWKDTVKLLLSHGADPNISCRSDGITPLGVCVYKNNFELFQIIIEQSIVSINQGLSNALDVAVAKHNLKNNCDRNPFIEEIIRYSTEHQLAIEKPTIADALKRLEQCRVPSIPCVMGINTFFQNRPRENDDSDEDETSLIITMNISNKQ